VAQEFLTPKRCAPSARLSTRAGSSA
jgi:hypothetical protein